MLNGKQFLKTSTSKDGRLQVLCCGLFSFSKRKSNHRFPWQYTMSFESPLICPLGVVGQQVTANISTSSWRERSELKRSQGPFSWSPGDEVVPTLSPWKRLTAAGVSWAGQAHASNSLKVGIVFHNCFHSYSP